MKIEGGENIISGIQIIIDCYMVIQNMATHYYSLAGDKSVRGRLTSNLLLGSSVYGDRFMWMDQCTASAAFVVYYEYTACQMQMLNMGKESSREKETAP